MCNDTLSHYGGPLRRLGKDSVRGTCFHVGDHSPHVPHAATWVEPPVMRVPMGWSSHWHLTFGPFSMKRLASHTQEPKHRVLGFKVNVLRGSCACGVCDLGRGPALSSASYSACPFGHFQSSGRTWKSCSCLLPGKVTESWTDRQPRSSTY